MNFKFSTIWMLVLVIFCCNTSYAQTCGEVIDVTTTHGQTAFSLPGQTDIKCVWRLSVRNEKWRAVLTFSDVTMDCSAGDLIKVYDGEYTESTPRIWSFCGGTRHLFLSSSYTVNVELTAANSDTVQFKFRYISTPEQVCGKTMPDLTTTAFIHELTSPLYPNTYPDYTDCVWHIKAPLYRDKIKVILKEVHLAPGCQDSLEIYEGILNKFASETAAAQYCGDNTFRDEEFVSDGANITIRFTSDEIGGAKGWSLTYQTVEIDLPVQPITEEEGVHAAAVGAGVGVGVIVLLVIVVVAVIFVMRYRWRKERENLHGSNTGDPSVPALGRRVSSSLNTGVESQS